MTAGQRAQEQSRQAADRVARLRQDLARAEKQQRAWEAGAAGERRVAQQLDLLVQHGWTALHDVHWPGRPKANLDHVLIGPGGIIIIDAKNWTGTVTAVGGVLRQNGYRRDREMQGALEQAAAVAALLHPMHRTLVRSMLCLVGQPELQDQDGPVPVVGIDLLVSSILSLPANADPATMAALRNYLTLKLSGPQSPALLTSAPGQGAAGHGVVSSAGQKRTHYVRAAAGIPRYPDSRGGQQQRSSPPRGARRQRRSRSRHKVAMACLNIVAGLAIMGAGLVLLLVLMGMLTSR